LPTPKRSLFTPDSVFAAFAASRFLLTDLAGFLARYFTFASASQLFAASYATPAFLRRDGRWPITPADAAADTPARHYFEDAAFQASHADDFRFSMIFSTSRHSEFLSSAITGRHYMLRISAIAMAFADRIITESQVFQP